MSTAKTTKRAPKSIRKHLRTQKALLRRTLPPKEAARAIEQLVRRVRQKGGAAPAPAK